MPLPFSVMAHYLQVMASSVKHPLIRVTYVSLMKLACTAIASTRLLARDGAHNVAAVMINTERYEMLHFHNATARYLVSGMLLRYL